MRSRYCSVVMHVCSQCGLRRWSCYWRLHSTMGWRRPLSVTKGLRQLWWKTGSMSRDVYWQNRTDNSQHLLLFFCGMEPRNGLVNGDNWYTVQMPPYVTGRAENKNKQTKTKILFQTSICITWKLFLKWNGNRSSLRQPLDLTNVLLP